MNVPQTLYQCFSFGVPLAIIGALFGFRWREGLWGNVLGAGAVCFSALIAVGWWELLAEFLSKQMPSMLYLSDTVAVWTIFVVSLLVITEATRAASRVRVKFPIPVENTGNWIALVAMFITLYGFFLFSLDLAGVGERENATVSSSSPPIRIMRVISAEELSSLDIKILRILSAGNLSSFTNPQQFDADGNFREVHLERRKKIWEDVTKSDGSLFYKGEVPPRRH